MSHGDDENERKRWQWISSHGNLSFLGCLIILMISAELTKINITKIKCLKHLIY
jgi:hypothetical protein